MPKAKRLSLRFMYNCGKLGMTFGEIGALCGLSESAILNRIGNRDAGHDPEWNPKLKEAYQAGKAELAQSLRRAQIHSALGEPERIVTIKNADGTESEQLVKGRAGNPVSQIWLGKQLLGQTDQVTPAPRSGTTNIFIAQWGGGDQAALPTPPAPAKNPYERDDTTNESDNANDVIDGEAEEFDPCFEPPEP